MFKIVLIGFLLVFGLESMAEPWMSNRFAQNCAACHAPGRLNRKPSKRRCTLSCQGCHVNPNGGGLRNQYGKWNSERWVRSFYHKMAWNKKTPSPLKEQRYMKKKLSKKKKVLMAKRGARLIGVEKVVEDEAPYMESSNYQAAPSKLAELMRITRNDPYRLERSMPVYAGGDFRMFFLQQSEGAANDKLEKGTIYPMVFDFGVRIRPIKEKLSFVYEGRALNSSIAPGSDPSSFDQLFGPGAGAITRSAYLLVDDLWYNSYAQYGYYRPMFGLYNTNHNNLMTDYTQLGIRTVIKGLGIGAGYNVTFGMLNMHMQDQAASGIAAETGFDLTMGMRFVSYGAHIQGTYWDSGNDEVTAGVRKRTMWNINAGGVLGRFIFNGEVTNVSREAQGGLDETTLIAADLRYRFWREMYAKISYTTANAATDPGSSSGTGISPGSGREIAYGVRAFTISGLDFEALMADKAVSIEGGTDRNEKTLSIQMHAYY